MTTADMLRSLKAQRAVVRHYAERAADLDLIASDFQEGGMPLHARKARGGASLVRMAARREAEPEGGA